MGLEPPGLENGCLGHTDCRGSLAVPLGACSYPGQPEREAAGRPEVPPLEWQVEGGPLVAQTDLAVEVEAHSQNLQTNRTEKQTPCLPTAQTPGAFRGFPSKMHERPGPGNKG